MLKRNLNVDCEELVIVVDMVNGFCKEGALASPSVMRVVPRQIEILEEYSNKENGQIIFIRDCHTKDSVEFKTFGEHCLEGTEEVEVIDELQRFINCEYLKNSTNFMFAPDFMNDIDKLKNLKKVLLMGVLSDRCDKDGGIGLKTYFNQNNRDIEVAVLEDCCDTYSAPGHEADIVNEESFKDMENAGIVRVKRR